MGGGGEWGPDADGSPTVKGTGVNLWYFFADNLGPGEPGALVVVKGKSTEQFDGNGDLVQGPFEHDGSIENLCATPALATRGPRVGDGSPGGASVAASASV